MKIIELEPCEYDRHEPRDLIHVARCALLYIGAMDLQVDEMKTHIVQVLQQTTKDVASFMRRSSPSQALDHAEIEAATFHLEIALEVAYSHKSREATLPLRHALAILLDILFPLLLQNLRLPVLLSAEFWRQHSALISQDLIKIREIGQSSTTSSEADSGRPGHDDAEIRNMKR